MKIARLFGIQSILREKSPLIKLKDKKETCRKLFTIYNFYNVFRK